ncbi:hypothetical protein CUR178_06386 [Leishmania enriettii]|uniref:TOG domain-containing protein n=1 Tax=Leishmania enriettii TaxID=5663 RepID=A0A836GW01_LEIEN|nr:hypothetical protein CUR178_06386 [Leishmania enriettii]
MMFQSEVKYGPRLPVYLCHFSSQDDVHRADALRVQDRHSCGWVSRKHAPYPQELGFRFDGVVSVNTIRILANESKISSCMIVFVAEPTAQEEQDGVCGPYSKATFKRLGHVRFSNNATTDYQARELKTVGLRHRCTYLKLVLRNPHANSYNIFQQVGVVALAVHGKLLRKLQEWIDTPLAIHIGERVIVPLNEMMPPSHSECAPSTPARATSNYSARVSELVAMKQKAVEEEDFDAAEALKQRIVTIEDGEREIARLEVEKQRAVTVEDYKLAKELKLRIDTLREETEKIVATPPNVAPSAMTMIDARSSSPPRRTSTADTPGSAPAHDNGNGAASLRPAQSGWNAYDERVVGGKGYYDLSDATSGLMANQSRSQSCADGGEAPLAGDEVPLTGDGADWEFTLNAAIKRASTLPAGPSPLTGDAAAVAKPYTRDLGVYCVACLFSGKGQQREAALRGVVSSNGSQALASHSDAAWAQLVLYMSVKGYGVGDKMAGAVIAACSALSKIVQGKLPGASANQVAESVTKVLPELTARLGESNTRVQDSVEKTVVALARSPLGHRRIVELLLVDPDRPNKKLASVRAHVSRINILSSFVDEFGLMCNTPDGLDTRSLCSLVLLPSLQHPNVDVRQAAVGLLAKLLYIDPGTTSGYIENIKPAQQALVEEQLEQYEQSQLIARSIVRKVSDMQADTLAVQRHGRGRAGSPQAEPRRPSALRTAEPAGRAADEAKPRAYSPPPMQRTPVPVGEIEYRRLRTCQFCGEYSSSFNEQNLDLHYVSACPMLCPCPLCDQVTEICQLQQHLVTECAKRRLVRECPRCCEAVRATEYSEHVSARKCIEAVATHSVCPLCHERFKSGMDGWRRHLASSPGCPNNPRRYDGTGLAM